MLGGYVVRELLNTESKTIYLFALYEIFQISIFVDGGEAGLLLLNRFSFCGSDTGDDAGIIRMALS